MYLSEVPRNFNIGILPEALRTNCLRCTEKQKTVTLRAIRRLKKEYPKIWAQLSAQWDPDSNIVDKFESTFGGKPQVVVPQASVQINNRFNPDVADAAVQNSISEVFNSTSAPTSTSTTTPSTTNPPSSTSTVSSTTTSSGATKIVAQSSTAPSRGTANTVAKISTATSGGATKTSFAATTNTPNFNTITVTAKPTKRPRPNLGANIQATVSLGPRIVGDLVDMVRSFERVLGQIAQQKLEFISRFLTG
ncbi:hypothetical protein NQ318_003930 [Aromia moschata]|uniref:Uncharacterized protein n=1 Tax=Aromia moschata TaxID=1265417 RepID=A0AAV8ZA39_9CUCU|nr:hypothetical protein NQ318_003930 [Aromia moschata]